tara:strand:- start:2910 stop:4949 length:2040 start_codon:yes stop_codon:yes gene_type:complete
MKKNNNIIIIQARQTSKRLPNKVLKKIGKRTVCEIIFERLKKSRFTDKIVFAIPNNKKNYHLKKHLKQINAEIFLGSEDNVLKRIYGAAKKFKSKNIIRITADCPLIDPKLVDDMLIKFSKNKFDYINNAEFNGYSDGFDIEVFTFSALKTAYKNARTQPEKEHVTPFLKNNKKMKIGRFKQVENFRTKLSIDHLEDYQNVTKIFEYFKPNIHFPIKSVFKNKLHIKILKKIKFKEDLLKNKTIKGQKLWLKANKIIPGGSMLLSKNPERYLPDFWPTYFKSAKGCKIRDYDNNNYIDLSLMGVGTNVLGYANSQIDNAVKKNISKSNMSTLNCKEEIILAEKLIELHPWADMTRFARAGGEANAIAIRIARAATNKDNVAFCGYHGWHDWYLSTNLNNKDKNKNLDTHLIKGLKINGVPKSLKKTVFPFVYGDIKGINNLIKEKNIGTIKMEVCRNTEPDKVFLKHIRKICNDNKIVLIFDECTTGFRQSLGGLHQEVGVNPDIAIFGKALGNGYAITAIIGKKEIMENAKESFISSTFWTERIGPTAALATINFMEKHMTWKKIIKIGKKIQTNWKNLANENNLKIKVNGIPSLTNFVFQNSKHQSYKTLITQEMLIKNILATNAVYPCINHEDNILNFYFDKLNDIFKLIKKCEDGYDLNKFLKSRDSMKEFRRLN